MKTFITHFVNIIDDFLLRYFFLFVFQMRNEIITTFQKFFPFKGKQEQSFMPTHIPNMYTIKISPAEA